MRKKRPIPLRSGSVSPFPLSQSVVWNGPEPVKGAPLLGASKRTLDDEDRSKRIAEEGKAGRNISERTNAKLVPSAAASNTPQPAHSIGLHWGREQLLAEILLPMQ